MLRITIDPEACMGHGRCYGLVPELFDSDAAGRPVVLLDPVPAGLSTRAQLARDSCPEQAIHITKGPIDAAR